LKDNFIRIVFIIVFFIFLSLKNIEFILWALIVLAFFTFRDFIKLNKRVLKSIIIFNLGVSLGYIIMALIKDMNPWHYIIYINLKVYILTYFVFWFFSKYSVTKFMSFSKDLSYLTTITLSQIYSYKKTFEDFKFAFKARIYKLTDKSPKFITRTFEFFLEKALKDSKERTLAMKTRGFFDD